MNEIGRLLLVLGLILAAVGLLFIFADKIPFIGRLPGDIVVDRPGLRFYFPLMTMIIVSALLSLILWLFRR